MDNTKVIAELRDMALEARAGIIREQSHLRTCITETGRRTRAANVRRHEKRLAQIERRLAILRG